MPVSYTHLDVYKRQDYINAIFDEFIEFHGDRYFGDDGAIVGGIAMFLSLIHIWRHFPSSR